MQAVRIREPGGPGVLEPVTVPVPRPGPAELLIQTAAAGINRPDILQREGRYPLPPDASPLPGLEVAGVVAELGADVRGWRVGDRVMALTHGGGYAEYCAAAAGHCLRVPGSLGLEEAAAVPETGFTVCYNVFMQAGLRTDETLLVHGGSSGIGSTAIQLAKQRGSRVVTTAGSDAKCEFCRELGADLAVNYRSEDWPAKIAEFLGGARVDVVLDMVAGDYVQKNLSLMARDGRYALIAFLRGDTAEINLRPIVGKRIVLTGSTLRPQTVAEKTAIRDRFAEIVLPLLESGAMKPIIDKRFALAEARRAHEYMETSAHMGKIVLTI
ncbi:MAG: NAD(P)H-quinone oxidoreductase [Pseudomonadota bacterium]